MKSLVFGGLDGIVTTFAVVAASVGGSLTSDVVLLLGFAKLIADGLAMGVGDYLSSQAEVDYTRAEHTREKWELDNHPEARRTPGACVSNFIELENSCLAQPAYQTTGTSRNTLRGVKRVE